MTLIGSSEQQATAYNHVNTEADGILAAAAPRIRTKGIHGNKAFGVSHSYRDDDDLYGRLLI